MALKASKISLGQCQPQRTPLTLMIYPYLYDPTSIKILQVFFYAGQHANEYSLTSVSVGGDEGQRVAVDEGDSHLLFE